MFKAIRDGGDDPHPAELKKPALSSDCVEYHDAYRTLGASRMWSQVGPNPIQMSEIDAFLRIIGIGDQAEKVKYLRLIRRMDQIELLHIQRKQRK